jgi:hypothetical protein
VWGVFFVRVYQTSLWLFEDANHMLLLDKPMFVFSNGNQLFLVLEALSPIFIHSAS